MPAWFKIQLIFSTTVEPGLLTGRLLHDLLDRRPGPESKVCMRDLMIGTAARGFALAGRWLKDKLPAGYANSDPSAFRRGSTRGAVFMGIHGFCPRVTGA